MKFSVIGAGSWETTLANLLTNNGHQVKIWAYEQEVVSSINNEHKNPFFVNHLSLNDSLEALPDMKAALDFCDYALFAIPSGFLKATITPHVDSLKKLKGIINVSKGFERGTGKRLSQIFLELLDIEEGSIDDNIACLSGPNLADEISREKLAAAVIAAPNEDLATIFQESLANDHFRIYRHSDRIGVELGGTLKNIFAIGAGMVDGLELGDNAKAAYLTRSLHELVRLGTALGGKIQTFYGLSGLGDLMATTSSPLSRNYKLGQALAKGTNLENYMATTKMVVEGVETAKIAAEWGKKLTLRLPITEELCRVLFENSPPLSAAKNLMSRDLITETE